MKSFSLPSYVIVYVLFATHSLLFYLIVERNGNYKKSILGKSGVITLTVTMPAGRILPSISHTSSLNVEQSITVDKINNNIISSELTNADSVHDISVGDTI